MDVAYIVRPGENEELRYSLRSLRHVPHGRVVLVGHAPGWVRDVGHVPTAQAPLSLATKRENAWTNMHALAEHGPEEFYYFEDDYHVLRAHPDGFPPMHRGALANHVAEYRSHYPRSHYTRLLAHTLAYVGAGARSWDVHAPLPVRRDLLAAVLAECDAAAVTDDDGRVLRPLWRTVYGTRHLGDGLEVTDPKGTRHPAGLLSTADTTWRRAGQAARRAHPRPGPYEA